MPPHEINYLNEEGPAFDNEFYLSSALLDNCAVSTSCSDGESTFISASSAHASRHVHFSDADDVIHIPGVNDFTYAEHRASWFSPYEITQMKFYRDKLLARLEKGKPCKCVHGKETTYRGLECMTQSAARISHQTNVKVLRAVAHEQERQRKLGTSDPEAIASKITALNAASSERALIIGKRDEEDALELHAAGKVDAPVKAERRRSKRWSFTILVKRS